MSAFSEKQSGTVIELENERCAAAQPHVISECLRTSSRLNGALSAVLFFLKAPISWLDVCLPFGPLMMKLLRRIVLAIAVSGTPKTFPFTRLTDVIQNQRRQMIHHVRSQIHGDVIWGQENGKKQSPWVRTSYIKLQLLSRSRQT